MIKLNLPAGYAQMDEASKQMSLEIALGQAIEEVQKSVVQLAGQVVALTDRVNQNQKQTGVDLKELADRIESNKPKVSVEVKTPEIKVDASKGLAMILNLFRRKR